MKTEIDNSQVFCRLCGKEFSSNLCLSIFSESGILQNLQHKISVILRLEISKSSSMPTQVCHMCLNKLDAAYDLYQVCEKAQDTIRKKLSLNKVDPFVQELHWSMIDERCKLLTENNPIKFGRSVFKLKINVEPPIITPLAQNGWTAAPGQVPLNYTNNVAPTTPSTQAVQPPQATQVIQTQYNQAANNISIKNNYQLTATSTASTIVQQATPNNNIQRINKPTPRPIESARRKCPRPIPCPPSNAQSSSPRRPAVVRETVDLAGPSIKKKMMDCDICLKRFPEDVIEHHMNLHRHKSFFSCIDCNKNFRSEEAMAKHRCNNKTDKD